MTRIRSYRNGDSPALAELWNRGQPDRGVVRPLNGHEFDALVIGKLGFESAGLLVAERDGKLIAYVHAGFGPVQPKGPSHQLDWSMGAVAMYVTDRGIDDPELDRELFLAAERYLRGRGAEVFYAGGEYPVNPFYWGIYGGSEWAGILDAHTTFRQAAQRNGYEPSAHSVLMEADLSQPEPHRDPKTVLARRLFRLDVSEDLLPSGWWESLALGLFRPTTFTLFDRASDRPVAHALSWDIAPGFAVGDGRCRTGLIELEVDREYRRRGLARYLVTEVFRHARSQMADLICVQTSSTNQAALNLYASLGFEQVDTATLYRLPSEVSERSRS